MKLTMILLTAAFLNVSAKGVSQQITYSGNNVALETVFAEVKKQTGYLFFYDEEVLVKTTSVSVNVVDVPLQTFLDQVFKGQPISYAIREKNIIVSAAKALPPTTFSVTAPPPPITGVVKDSTGMPLRGATVTNKRTKKSVQTNAKGEFTIDGEEGDELVLSYVGFENQKINSTRERIFAVLRASTSPLDEVQIKAYGTTSRRLGTGNITTIKSDEISRQPVSDPLLALQGRVPGMTINQSTGLQGGRININIRGTNSLTNGTQPLIIVDGVPYQQNIAAPSGGSYGALGQGISALNFIVPADIESIEVLKDADATSIYGSRGANGVVLITTKKGKPGPTRIDVIGSQGWQTVERRIKLLGTKEYLEMRHEAFKNDGVSPTEGNAPDLLVWDTTRYTDWQKDLIGKTAKYTDVHGVISGGTSTLQYLIGGNFHSETTVFPGEFKSQRGGSHFNVSGSSSNQRFKSSLSGSYTVNQTDFPGVDFASQINLPPNAPKGYNENGTLNWENSTWENPYARLITNILDASTSSLVANLDLNYHLLSNLIFKMNFGYTEINSKSFIGQTIAGVNPQFQSDARASADFTHSKNLSWITEPQIVYNFISGKNNFNTLIGGTFSSSNSEGQYLYISGILQDALIRFPAAATEYYARGEGTKYKYAAFFGQLTYNRNNKYILNLTARRDGSSRFGPRKQFANFGAIGGAWIVSEESFVRENVGILSFAKVRGSYGVTGNDQIGDYQYLDNYNFVQQTYQGERGLRVLGIFNPDFAWEKTLKKELGVDLGFLKNRVYISASYYSNKSDNQLVLYPLASITGNTSIKGNSPILIGNSGLEFVLTTQNVTSAKVEWSTSFNVSFSKNKLISNNGGTIGNKEGSSLSERALYEYKGLDSILGTYLFADSEGKPAEIGDGFRKSIDLAPKYFGGLQNRLRYRGIELNVLFQFVKQSGYNARFVGGRIPGRRFNQPLEVMNRWRNPGDVTNIQRFSQNTTLATAYSQWLNSDQSFEDAAYIRCKNISLSWTLPGIVKNRLRLNNIKVFLLAQNVFTITNYKGWDPETLSASTIPPMRTIVIGGQIAL